MPPRRPPRLDAPSPATGSTAESGPRRGLDRQRLARYFFFGAFLFLLYQSARLLLAFTLPLLAAGLLVLLVYPAHARLVSRWPNHPTGAAALSAGLTLLIIVLPLCGLGWAFFHEAGRLAPTARAWAAGLRELPELLAPAGPTVEALKEWLAAWHIDPQKILLDNLDEMGGRVTSLAGWLVRNAVAFALDLAALGCLVFVLLRDGPRLLRRLTDLVPMPAEHKELLLERIAETALAVVRGVLGVAAVQGALAGLGLAALRVPFPVVLGALTAIASPIPFLGVGLVLVPVVAGLYLSGLHEQAIKLALWSVCVVGTVDNLLRPLLISAQVRLPLWLLFFGVMGGLKLYGFAGLLIGPVIVTVALAFASIYRKEYRSLLDAGPPQAPPARSRG